MSRLAQASLRGVADLASRCCATPALASKTDKIEELVGLHDLKTAVAIGNYYLKQRTLFAVREELRGIGKEQNLGPQWNPADPHWKQARGRDGARRHEAGEPRQFSSLEWLSEEWAQLERSASSASATSIGCSPISRPTYGRKQIMIVDHGVAVHVQGALTFTGKMQYDVPGRGGGSQA